MESIEELKKKCGLLEKYGPEEITWTLNKKSGNWRERLLRPISIRITWLLLHTSISADQVTFLMLIAGLFTVFFLLPGQYAYTLIALIFYHIHILLDRCDGEVARYRKKFSLRGPYLDLMNHIIVDPLIIMGIAIGVFFNNPTIIPGYVFLILGFIGSYSYVLNNVARLKKYELYIDKKEFKMLEKLQTRFKKTQGSRIRDSITRFFRMNIFNALVIFAIFNILPYLVIIYAIINPLQAIARVYIEFKKDEKKK